MTLAARFTLAAVLALAAACLPRPAAAAGTLCGTVRDASSGALVPGAGIFVFTTTGAFTGHEGVSDAAGEFCIPGIPAGTYDLQVRRDDYRTTHVRGVQVTDDVTGVEIGVPRIGAALLPPLPNPARDRIEFRFQLENPGPVRLEVFDAAGRRVKGWSSAVVAAGEHSVAWDFRAAAGRTLPPGRYLARLTFAPGGVTSSITRAFARIR